MPVWFRPPDYEDEFDVEIQTSEDPGELEVVIGGVLPVGSIVLSSMTEQDESFLSPRRRRDTKTLIEMLEAIAQEIADPEIDVTPA
ncbi:hypothetical protein GCM10027298_23150 [Epidermidibacterium keratini]